MLVTGATGRVGRAVVDLLVEAGVPVRALAHRSESSPSLPASVEVFIGDLTVPESLDAALQGAGAVFLVWTAPPDSAAAVIEAAPVDDRDVAAVAARTLYEDGHTGGDYVLTGAESLSQAEQVRIIGEVLGRPIPFEELSPDEFRREAEASWPPAALNMLLAAWAATMGMSAYITSAVFDILGSPPHSFREWVTDNAGAFASYGPVITSPP